jgi:hypothetical protein
MAVTRRTLRLAEQLRIVIDREVDWSIRQLVQAWARAWLTIDAEWTKATQDLVEMTQAGRWPSQRDILRASSVQAALQSATREVVDLAEFAGVTVVTSARQVSTEVAFWQRQIITSQLPIGWARGEALPEKLPDQVLAAIVERTTERIESRKRPLADGTVDAMKRALVRGVAVGENPRVTARRMVTTSRSKFNGGLTRAMTLARTEVLDAYRSGAAAYQSAHDDVLQGWLWDAKLDARTCPSCWAMHGTEHPLLEPGPIDHHCGRCARTPLTRSWADLGIEGMDEPDSLSPDAQEVFRQMRHEDQLRVMGPVRLQALDTGALEWSDLSIQRNNPGWRDSRVPISVGDARRKLLAAVR